MFSLAQFKHWLARHADSKIVVTTYSPEHFTIDCLMSGRKIPAADKRLQPLIFTSPQAVKQKLAEYEMNVIYLDYDAAFEGEHDIDKQLWAEGLLVMRFTPGE